MVDKGHQEYNQSARMKMDSKENTGDKQSFRERYEAWECAHLGPNAMKSIDSKGRQHDDEPCSIRTIFQQDRDRILHCKAFRRLKHKTQVFIAPDGDHYRTRLTHTLEVGAIARTASVALALNENLTEAIALGHDLGHPPFGHSGEKFLNQIMVDRGFNPGFLHNIQSVRIVEEIENDGRGLNLAFETRDGIQFHTKGMDDISIGISEGTLPCTEEGRLVRIADRFAYLYADLEDAIRAELISLDEIPLLFDEWLREKPSRILDRLVANLIEHSYNTGCIALSDDTVDFMDNLKDFLLDTVYNHPKVREMEPQVKTLIYSLFERFETNPDLYDKYVKLEFSNEEKRQRNICDYIAGMTDQYAIMIFQRLFVPRTWEHF